MLILWRLRQCNASSLWLRRWSRVATCQRLCHSSIGPPGGFVVCLWTQTFYHARGPLTFSFNRLSELYCYIWTPKLEFLSIIDILSIRPYEEILSVSDTTQYSIHKKSETIKMAPKGKVIVVIGIRCGPLCGHGVSMYFDKENGEWSIIEVMHWIA